MKKFVFSIICLILSLLLCSCGNISDKDKSEIKDNIKQMDADTANASAIKSAEEFFSDSLNIDSL
ncbi:MAG: hypothetical protein PHF55_07600 [Bacteroidales bacterium]|jgi:uncharacterized lipoprotein NlpE involved in copper resistance|nr:hypothetical protein [Bacteroidales bacterium]MDN5356802.1 hypothetical protein [Rikenellaceae bacterium]